MQDKFSKRMKRMESSMRFHDARI